MDIDFKVIGRRLKKARLHKKLTQENLAEKLGVSVAYLSRVERGNISINLKRLTQICNLLDISSGKILNGVAVNSNQYLNDDFSDLLKDCPPDKAKLIYNIAQTIINEN